MFGPSCLQASYKSAHLRTEDILSDQIVWNRGVLSFRMLKYTQSFGAWSRTRDICHI